MDSSPPTPPPRFAIPANPTPDVSIIVPARNEGANLGACLESLTTQIGVSFEIIVVDDASTDRTPEIAQSFGGVQVISAGPLPKDKDTAGKLWTGKNNALIAGAKQSRAPWLLFTDADTIHRPGSLARALAEVEQEQADLLSYSPEQIVVTFAERTVMPVVFAELAVQYPPQKVRDRSSETSSEIVAANGQYILVHRAAYDAVGGHAAVATEILEDVALARRFRDDGKRVYFRYGGDAVRTRMYRNWTQLREGWTKNLALLFPQPGFLAFQIVFLWCAAWLALGIAVLGASSRHLPWMAFALFWLLAYRRISAAHFATVNNLLAITVGLPIFAYLLLRSKNAHKNGRVSWKGRVYAASGPGENRSAAMEAAKPISGVERQELRTESREMPLWFT
jgi:glycosyltransferase involved in cell wall biosynthesis